MKILIFYASYGGGHLNAARSVEEYLKTNYPNNDIEMIDCMKYAAKRFDKVAVTAYNGMAKKAPWAWGRIYEDSKRGPLAHLTSRSNKIFAITLLKLLREKKPDLIISTHPFGSQMCSYLKRKGKIDAKIATIITDFAPHDQYLVGHESGNYFFVAHNKMKAYLVLKKIPKGKIFVTGIPISSRFLKEYNKSEVLKNLNLVEGKKTVLFFGGGELGLGKAKIFGIFENLLQDFDDIQIVAIAGKNEKMKEHFEDLVREYKKEDSVVVLGFTKMVPELMSASDLVITKPGGLTTSESLASNLPMIIVNPIPGQEEENAELLEKKGIAIWIKRRDNASTVLKDLLSHPDKLEEMKEKTSLLAKKNSTENICKILIDEHI